MQIPRPNQRASYIIACRESGRNIGAIVREVINRIPIPYSVARLIRRFVMSNHKGRRNPWHRWIPGIHLAQIISQRAHINRQKLFNILRDITAPVRPPHNC